MASKFKKGDEVMVIAGSNKGISGKILSASMLKKTNKILVQGVNLAPKNRKSIRNANDVGVKFEKPIDASNVMHIDPKTSKPTRIGFKNLEKKKVRYAKKSGELIVSNTH